MNLNNNIFGSFELNLVFNLIQFVCVSEVVAVFCCWSYLF